MAGGATVVTSSSYATTLTTSSVRSRRTTSTPAAPGPPAERVERRRELVARLFEQEIPEIAEGVITVEAISRIPAGQSLFLGGFYDYSNSQGDNKVPVLSTIPLVGRLFSTDMKKLEQVSLVFVITPRVYDASSPAEVPDINWHMREYSGMQPEDIGDASVLLPKADWPNATPSSKSSPIPVSALPTTRVTPRQSWVRRIFGRKNDGAQ